MNSDRDVDARGNCSKCGGTHYGSYYCSFTESQIKEMEMDEQQPAAQMPRYKCHKEVWALKIEAVEDRTPKNDESDGSCFLVPVNKVYAPIRVGGTYMRKHKPETGGYYVVYADGYQSYSPGKAFEDGYTRL